MESLYFRYPFRKYQRMILEHVREHANDDKHHIVAPPGSGKTIVGIELIRRFGEPAVVFAPTTTIQQQWCDEVGMFVEGPKDDLVSRKPDKIAPINVLTYQVISTTGESDELVRRAARELWVEELVSESRVSDEPEACGRLETLRCNNPQTYTREMNKRYRRVKRELLRREGVNVARFLHPNARLLIDELVSAGVRTVVLDECHHLLDYWAIVLRHLIGRIENPRVIGLTATLPSLEDGREYENYTSLLGEVDFEIPTPAVVREGDLAPYRDLVYFTKPTERETNYLKNVQRAFEKEISTLTDSKEFRQWVIETALGSKDEGAGLRDLLREEPVFSISILRFLRRIGQPIPGDPLLVPPDVNEPLTLEDWAALLERYGLDRLRTSNRKEDHQRLAGLRRILQPFGLTLTERGLRASRSPGDLVLTFSESKDNAVADILATEKNALGDSLRAVVVTDFESMSSGSRPEEALDREAGSARRVFERLVYHYEAGRLDPILVTGRTVLADADLGPPLIFRFNDYLEHRNLRATCRYEKTDIPGILEVVGEGPDWSSRVYVGMITEAFEEGVTQCLVGTRGILGEGWDSPKLNTLVDLTSVTTSTSVQQLRGRCLRKDPGWPRKVGHHWDVICVAPEFERGDIDLRRFAARHNRYWGVEPPQIAGLDLPPSMARITKGVSHVSPTLAFALSTLHFKWINFDDHTRFSLAQVGNRERSYKLWGVGEEYSNSLLTTTRLEAKELRIRTSYTVQDTLEKMLQEFRATGIVSIIAIVYFVLVTIANASFSAVNMFLGAAVATALAVNAASAYRLGRAVLLEQRPDTILKDAGRAVLAALKDANLVDGSLQPESIKIIGTSDAGYEISLAHASPEDSEVFIQALRQIFGPVKDPRYLILRQETRLPSPMLSLFWVVFRPFVSKKKDFPPAYHPVPDILAVRKERAEALARYWEHYVGGGELVYTRNETGRWTLLQARAQPRPEPKSLAFKVWK